MADSKSRKRRRVPTRDGLPIIRAIGRPFEPYRDIYHFLLRRAWSEFFAMVAAFFLFANAMFAAVYTFEPNAITNARNGSFEDAFFFSVQTMATIGYGAMAPATRLAHITVTCEAMFGILMTAIITGICFAKFSRPTALMLFSDQMVIAPRDGVPFLMFRIANRRHNQVAEARAHLVLLRTETTREGETIRRPQELKLERDRNPIFSLTWLVMHRIDESSPFFGADAIAKLRQAGAQLFVSVSGLDETVGQTINARWTYELDHIRINSRFADVLSVAPDGAREIDYRSFHRIIPASPAADPVPLPEPPLAEITPLVSDGRGS